MPELSKTKQPNMLLRWVLALSVLGMLAVGVAGYLIATERISAREAENAYKQANIYLAEGNMAAAIPLIEKYLAKYPENETVLAGYADIVQQVTLPNNAHFRKAKDAHERLLAIDQDRTESVLALMDIYDKAGMGPEAIRQVDRVLSNNPSMIRAYAIKAKYLASEGDYEKAYSVLDEALIIEPMAIETNRIRLDLMGDQGLRTSQKLAWVSKVVGNYPDDPRGKLLQAYALVNGEVAEKQAAIPIMEDLMLDEESSESVYDLALGINDAMGRFDESIDLTREAIELYQNDSLKATLVKRLWDAQRPEDIVVLFQGENAWDPESVRPFLHLLAWSYQILGDQQAFDKMVEMRRSSTANKQELLWYNLLELTGKAASDMPGGSGGRIGIDESRIKMLVEDGLDLVPLDPYLHYFAGQLDAREGKYEAAIAHLEMAQNLAVSWRLPSRLIVANLLQSKQPILAYEKSYQRYFGGKDRSGAMLMLYLRAAQEVLPKLNRQEFLQVASVVEYLQSERPSEALLPLQVKIIAMQGETTHAKELIRGALVDGSKYESSTLLELVKISESEKMGLTQEILDELNRVHGSIPQVAMYEALQVFSEDGLENAKSKFNDLKPSNLSVEENVAWDMAWVRSLEKMAPSDAKEEWEGLVEKHAQNYGVLKAAINASSVWGDLKLARKVLAQLEKVANKDDYEVKIAEIRLSLFDIDKAAGATKQRLLGQTALELTKLKGAFPFKVLPNVLMGEVEIRLGKSQAAAQDFAEAFRLAPDRYDLLIKQASALRKAGQIVPAESLLRGNEGRFSGNGQALLAMGVWWREAGKVEDAQRCISMAAKQMPGNRLLELESVQLLAGNGRINLATEKIYELLQTPTPETVLLAAKLFGRSSDEEGLKNALLALDKIAADMHPSEFAWMQGEVHWRLGDVEFAVSKFKNAMADSSFVNQVAKSWLTLALDTGEKSHFQNALNDIGRYSDLQTPLSELVTNPEILVAGLTGETKNVLVETINGIISPEDALILLQSVSDVVNQKASWHSVLSAVEKIRKKTEGMDSPSVLVLHVASLLRVNEVGMAKKVVSDAITRFPNNAQINLLALTIATEQGEWAEVIKRSEKLLTHGGRLAQIAVMNGSQAALRIGQSQVAIKLLNGFPSPQELNDDGIQQLRALKIVANYAQGVLPSFSDGLIDTIMTDEKGRQHLLSNLLIVQPPAPSIVVSWMEELDKRFASLPAVERIRLAGWMRMAWDRFGTPEMATRCRQLLVVLLEDEKTTEASSLMLGQMAEAERNWPEAIDYYEKTVSTNRRNVLAWNNVAMVYSRLSMHDKAIDAAKVANGLAPSIGFVLDTLALVSLGAGNYTEANEAIEKAMAIEPAEPAWKLTALDCYIKDGNAIKGESIRLQLLKMQQDGLLDQNQREQFREMQLELQGVKMNAKAA